MPHPNFSVPVSREIVVSVSAAYLDMSAGPESLLKAVADALASRAEVVKGGAVGAHLVNVATQLRLIASDSRALIEALYSEGR